MNDNEMHVKVSGRAVYDAVKNYLNNNETLQKAISATVQGLIDDGTLQANAERFVKQQLDSYFLKHMVEKAVQKILETNVNATVQAEVNKAIKEALRNSVFVLPKVQE